MATSIGVGSDEQNRGVMDMIIKYTNNLMKPFEIFKLLQQAQGIPAATTLLIWQNLVKANPNHFIAYLEQLKKKDRDDQITQLNKARVLHNELKLLYQNAASSSSSLLLPNNSYCAFNASHGDYVPVVDRSYQKPFPTESSPNVGTMEDLVHDACFDPSSQDLVDSNINNDRSASYPTDGHGNDDGGVERYDNNNAGGKSLFDELDEAFEYYNSNKAEMDSLMEQFIDKD